MIKTQISGIDLKLKTDPSLFSPGHVDRGTLAMLTVIRFQPDDKVLDLGCGYGLVGIYAAKSVDPDNVVMTDIDKVAVRLSRDNAALNGVAGIRIVQGDTYESIDENDFTVILSNPPYHTDFSVPKRIIEKGFNRLALGGRLLMVTKRKTWYKNKLITIFGGVKIHVIDGYFVFEAQKRSVKYGGKKKKEG